MNDDINYEEKIKKFNLMTNNQNQDICLEFLSLSNWDELKAIKMYEDFVSTPSSNIRKETVIKECLIPKNFNLLTNIKSILGIRKDNVNFCNQFDKLIPKLIKTQNNFIKILKTNKVLVILYNKDTKNLLIRQLKTINNDKATTIYFCKMFVYPLVDISREGDDLIKQLSINRFPCYVLCRYKNEKKFDVLDKLEGAFYIDIFRDMIIPFEEKIQKEINNRISQNQNNNNKINSSVAQQNNNINYSAVNKVSNLNNIQNNDNPNKNIQNSINNNWSVINKINNIDNNKINKNDNNEQNLNKNNYNNINENKINNENKNKNINNVEKDNKKNINTNENKIDSNNNSMNVDKTNNKNSISNEFKNNNILPNKKPAEPIKPPKKEYIPDYRDYDFGDNIDYSLFNDNNLNNNLYSNNDFYNYDNIPKTDKEIMNDVDKQMKKLEIEEEQKRKKEIEEKAKIEKEENEKKLKEQLEKEEKEIFSKLIPEEPDDNNPDKCIIILRFPNGEKSIQRKFLKTNKISVLYDYIRSLGREIYTEEQNCKFSIIQTFPFKDFNDKINNTLEEEGLFPNAVLQIKESD